MCVYIYIYHHIYIYIIIDIIKWNLARGNLWLRSIFPILLRMLVKTCYNIIQSLYQSWKRKRMVERHLQFEVHESWLITIPASLPPRVSFTPQHHALVCFAKVCETFIAFYCSIQYSINLDRISLLRFINNFWAISAAVRAEEPTTSVWSFQFREICPSNKETTIQTTIQNITNEWDLLTCWGSPKYSPRGLHFGSESPASLEQVMDYSGQLIGKIIQFDPVENWNCTFPCHHPKCWFYSIKNQPHFFHLTALRSPVDTKNWGICTVSRGAEASFWVAQPIGPPAPGGYEIMVNQWWLLYISYICIYVYICICIYIYISHKTWRCTFKKISVRL